MGGPALGQPGDAAVYVASQEAGSVAGVDPGASAAGPTIFVGPGPAGLAAGPDGTLYLTHPDHGTVTAVEARTGRVLRRLRFRGQPFGIAVSADGAHLFVGDWQAGTVSRLAAESGLVEAVVGVGREPAGLVLDRTGRLFVAERGSDAVGVLDVRTLTRRASLPVGRAPFALALSPAQDRLYVANVRSNDLSVIDAISLKPLATVPAGRSPYGVAASPDGRLLLVSNQESGSVSVLDAGDLTVRERVAVGRYSEGIAVAGSRAYVANWFSADVSVIDLATLRETGRLPVAEGPRAIIAIPAETAP
jgi:YVTN family beta-propeller protein